MKNLICCSAAGVLALVVGGLCHRCAPSLGLVLMPMFWPLAALSVRVPARWAVPTAALVPFVSCLVTGMPAWPFVVAVKFAALSVVVAVATKGAVRLCRNKKGNVNE